MILINNLIKKIGIGVVLIITSMCTNAELPKLSESQKRCISQNAYHEAKGEGDKGMLAVIWVTLNRMKDDRFPKTACGVVKQPSQFSWVSQGKRVTEPTMYKRAEKLVDDVLSGKAKDVSQGSLYFHSRSINPSWSRKMKYTCTIGNHKFFKPRTKGK